MFTSAALVVLIVTGYATSADLQQRSRNRNPLKVGQDAPKFEIKELKTEKKFKLASNIGKRPTVLIFGSYT
jgi:hypothetical protein